jgi:hypothetical protein
MNMNALLGIIGLSLLVFVAAFAIGRLNRASPALTPQPTSQVVSPRRSAPTPSAAVRAKIQDSVAAAMLAQNAAVNTIDLEAATEATEEEVAPTAAPVLPPKPPAAPPKPSAAELAAARQRAAESRIAIAARQAHADQMPDAFKKYYAQELPEDAISDELNVQVSVGGEQAEVITLSSPSFNAENQNFVLQQVRSELTELGFKQVTITDGKAFTTKTSL